MQRSGEALEDLGGSLREAAAPELHTGLRVRGLLERRAHLDRQADQVDEAARVALIVFGAHGEAGDIERIERIRRLAADRLDVAFVEPQRHLARSGFAGLFEERIERFAQRREPQAVVNHLGVIERELLFVVRHVFRQRQRFQLAIARP